MIFFGCDVTWRDSSLYGVFLICVSCVPHSILLEILFMGLRVHDQIDPSLNTLHNRPCHRPQSTHTAIEHIPMHGITTHTQYTQCRTKSNSWNECVCLCVIHRDCSPHTATHRHRPISSLNINKESKLIINLLHVTLSLFTAPFRFRSGKVFGNAKRRRNASGNRR